MDIIARAWHQRVTLRDEDLCRSTQPLDGSTMNLRQLKQLRCVGRAKGTEGPRLLKAPYTHSRQQASIQCAPETGIVAALGHAPRSARKADISCRLSGVRNPLPPG